jgi:hypothetical protein
MKTESTAHTASNCPPRVHNGSPGAEFLVYGKKIPQVDFDIDESYAGNLPNAPAGNSSLFFWFFPSDNPAASDEIVIWLNGGPGCCSMVGPLQENGLSFKLYKENSTTTNIITGLVISSC